MQRWFISLLILTAANVSASVGTNANANAGTNKGATLNSDQTALATSKPTALISIIIDDLGDRLSAGRRAISLPGAFTYSFLPHTPFVKTLTRQANDLNKEIMLHLPMESEDGRRLGPGGLVECMTQAQFNHVVKENLRAIPYARGVNNHMGSLLTKRPILMDWLMQSIAENGHLYFVDSRTTKESVIPRYADNNYIVNASRDVFLDYLTEDAEVVRKQLRALIKRAKRKGSALAIGHPHPETLAVLEEVLPQFAAEGVRLVPVSELIRSRQQKSMAWHESLSP